MSQLLKDTDDFDNPGSKPTIREWWKCYNIKDAIDNIQASWEEVKTSTLNASWKSLWKDIIDDFKGFPSFSATVRNIVEIGRKVGGDGFSDMEEDDVMELIDSHDELNVDDLMDMTPEQKEEVEEQGEVLQVKDLSMKRLASLFLQLDNIAQQFLDENPSFERSLQFKRGLDNILTPYKEMYAQKQKLARQTSMMQYLRPRSASPVPTASEPGPPFLEVNLDHLQQLHFHISDVLT
jgi:hypothetical protein